MFLPTRLLQRSLVDATLGVEIDPTRNKLPYRAYVSGSFGGGRQCYRSTFAEAKNELERLFEAEFG